MYNVLLEDFCETHELGAVVESYLFPKGMTHQTFFVMTATGKYVIKALNPDIVLDPKKRAKLIAGEFLAEVANGAGIKSISANRINGQFITEHKGQSYMVFPFCEGTFLPGTEVTHDYCFNVGELLAKLHLIDFKAAAKGQMKIPKYIYGRKIKQAIDWQSYAVKISKKKKPPKWLPELEANVPDWYDLFATVWPAFLRFKPKNQLISHGGLSNPNILWHEEQPHLIDWETAGYIDPTFDCFYTATRFAIENFGDGKRVINPEKVNSFLTGYMKHCQIDPERIETIFNVIVYRRLEHLHDALKTYTGKHELEVRRKARRRILFSMSILKALKAFQTQLPTIKTHIINAQPEVPTSKNWLTALFRRR